MNSGRDTSDFVVEAWLAKRWRPIARSDYEAAASLIRLRTNI
jgi:hypothetical protein